MTTFYNCATHLWGSKVKPRRCLPFLGAAGICLSSAGTNCHTTAHATYPPHYLCALYRLATMVILDACTFTLPLTIILPSTTTYALADTTAYTTLLHAHETTRAWIGGMSPACALRPWWPQGEMLLFR